MPPLYSGQWIRPKSWTGIEGSSEGGKEWNQPHTYNSNSARSHFPSEKALQCQQILNLYRTREFIQAPSKANITGGEGRRAYGKWPSEANVYLPEHSYNHSRHHKDTYLQAYRSHWQDCNSLRTSGSPVDWYAGNLIVLRKTNWKIHLTAYIATRVMRSSLQPLFHVMDCTETPWTHPQDNKCHGLITWTESTLLRYPFAWLITWTLVKVHCCVIPLFGFSRVNSELSRDWESLGRHAYLAKISHGVFARETNVRESSPIPR